MQLRIDTVEPRAGAPMLLQFQNGYVTEDFAKIKPSAVVLSGEGKTVAVTEIGGILYAGEENEEELGKTLLLVRSHKNGKVRLVEVGNASMRAVLSSGAVPPAAPIAAATPLDVSRKFGSKRDKQVMEQREKLKVNTATMQEQLKQVAEDMDAVENIDLKTYTKTDSEDFYIPPINRKAQNVTDVYKISDILTDEQIERITSEIEGQEWTHDLHPFIKSLVKHDTNVENALALYANSLLHLYTATTKDIFKKTFAACEYSSALNEICLENFVQTVYNRRTRSNALKDKTLCHLIVLIFLLNSYKFCLNDFANMVKVSPSTLAMKTRAVGAYVSPDKKTAVLKLPLNAAKTFLTKRKSSRF